MAVPKRKVSKARRDKRRSSHWKLETPGIVTCPKCGAYRLPHRMCKNCLTSTAVPSARLRPSDLREERLLCCTAVFFHARSGAFITKCWTFLPVGVIL